MGDLDKAFDERKGRFISILNYATGVKIASINEEREIRRLLAKYFEGRIADGDIGEVQAFYQRGEVDPEMAKLLREYQLRLRAATHR